MRNKSDTVKVEERYIPLLSEFRNVVLCMDISFVDEIPFLISFSERLDLTMVKFLSTRSKPEVFKAIEEMTSSYERNQDSCHFM